jgi:hypothetical protein
MSRNRNGWLGAVVLTVAPLAAIWVLSRPGPRNDFTERVVASEHATTLQRGSDWTLERLQHDGYECIRIRIGERATSCTGGPLPAGSGQSTEVRGLAHHFALIMFGSTAPVAVVMFSSRSAGVAHAMALASTNVYITAVEFQPGEEAWGYHVLDSKGGVVSNQSLLPP